MAPPTAPVASSSSRKPKKLKQKEKSRKETAVSSRAEAADAGISTRNEGIDSSLAYAPPAGHVPADYDVEFGEFDYDAVKADERAELWLIRAPTAVCLYFCASSRCASPHILTGCSYSFFFLLGEIKELAGS
jgi:hypothetical protein